MLRFGNHIGSSKRGSLVLSLVASGTVAATIVATHMVAQRFASGAVGAFNQQEAYILAQKSLAVAGLMVNRNLVTCSNMLVDPGRSKQVRGCSQIGPLSDDDIASDFYSDLGLNDSWFAVVSSTSDSTAYGEKYLVFKHPDGAHPVFKNAEIVWALRSFKDTNLRSISSVLDRGYVCRHKDTGNVIENGFCLSEGKLLSNRDSDLLSDENRVCQDENNADISDSVCDYYEDSDGDDAIVFISVKVPYQSTDAEEEKEKVLVVNAAIRRPMSVVRTYVEENTSICPISCGIAKRPNMGSSNVEHPDCVGFVSGVQSGGEYFQNNIHSVEAKIKVKNYGPGVLYGLQLLKEDVDSRTGRLLGRSMVGFSDIPLEPVHSPDQEGERGISHITPCYSAGFYRMGLERITCDCNSSDSSDFKNTAGGVVCLKEKSVCGGKSIFAGNASSTLEGSEARESLSGCLFSPGSRPDLPAVSNSILTVFEQPCDDTADCQFTRIDDDQTTDLTESKSWCGNKYVSSTVTGRTERPNVPITTAHSLEETVFPAASQSNVPLPGSEIMP